MMLKTDIRNHLIAESQDDSIQLNLLVSEELFEYCLYDKDMMDLVSMKSFNFEKRITNPSELEEAVKQIISSEDDLNKKQYAQVIVSFHNQFVAIVPNELYDPNNQKEYLKFGVRLLEGDKISVDDLPELEAKTVYIPYANIVNTLLNHFGTFDYQHASGPLATAFYRIYKKDVSKNYFVNVNKNSLDIFYFEEAKLQFYNTFLYATNEDLLYYVLFSMEQLGLSPDVQNLYLTGDIDKDSGAFDLLYTYIRNISLLREPVYSLSDELYKQYADLKKHNHFLLFSQL